MMSIKASTTYNKTTGNFEGIVDLGNEIVVDDENEVATEALVFMLVSLRKSWKYPIGYVLINKVDATTLHSLLSHALLSIEHKLQVYSITMDGTSTNLAAMELFGCKLKDPGRNFDGRFEFAGFGHFLYFIPDPPHMLKLGRNALADLGVLKTADQTIEWRYFCKLHNIQTDEGLKFGNKLSKRHIEFKRLKMKVNVAAQTLSSSVSDAMQLLMQFPSSGFENFGATIEFIRVLDRVFDILNSRWRI